jgi:hypothetical protein
MEKLHAPIAAVRPVETRADGMGDGEADGAADEGAEHTGNRRGPETEFEEDHQPRQREREPDVREKTHRERLKDRSGIRDCGDKQEPCRAQTRHWTPSHERLAAV